MNQHEGQAVTGLALCRGCAGAVRATVPDPVALYDLADSADDLATTHYGPGHVGAWTLDPGPATSPDVATRCDGCTRAVPGPRFPAVLLVTEDTHPRPCASRCGRDALLGSDSCLVHDPYA